MSFAFYNLPYESRALEALLGDKENDEYLVGTTYSKGMNEMHRIAIEEGGEGSDTNNTSHNVSKKSVYSHPQEIYQICPHPFNKKLVCTRHANNKTNSGATIWALNDLEDNNHPSNDDDGTTTPLVPSCSIETSNISSIAWNSHSNEQNLVTIQPNEVTLWQLNQSGDVSEKAGIKTSNGSCVKWDPHQPNVVAFTSSNDYNVSTWDVRTTNGSSTVIESAHNVQVTRDLDFNPNMPHHIASSGDDGRIKFWDLRRTKTPLKTVSDHTHWVWCVRYNRHHDQLLASAGSDTLVNLWRIPSVSSSPLSESTNTTTNTTTTCNDTNVQSISEHQESVYSLAWSASDSWTFASLGYNGRVLFHQVPSSEKYKILL